MIRNEPQVPIDHIAIMGFGALLGFFNLSNLRLTLTLLQEGAKS